MGNEMLRVARTNRSPTWVIAIFYLAAVFLMLAGGWMLWQVRHAGIDLGSGVALSMVIAGVSFGGDASRRLAVNRVIDEMVAAIDREG